MLSAFEELAIAAGVEIMAVYRTAFAIQSKSDLSPVTEADRRAETVILSGLRARYPKIPCVAEEEIAAGASPGDLGEEFFLVDPLDGTREFVDRNPDFTVNIALIRAGRPVAGVVYAPASGAFYSARPGEAFSAKIDGEGAIVGRRRIKVRAPKAPPVIVASRSHRTPETDAFIEKHEGCEIVSIGSSLKFCLIAEGAADLYCRFGRTMEWDTAAGDAVLRAAGGTTSTEDGAPLRYGKRNQAADVDFANPWFIARGMAG